MRLTVWPSAPKGVTSERVAQQRWRDHDVHRGSATIKSFYEKVFDVAAINEDEDSVAFKFENLIVNLLEVGAAHELIGPAPVGHREAGSRFQLTIWVEDVDAVCAELESRGITLLNGPMNREWACAQPASPTLTATSGRSPPTSPRTQQVDPRRPASAC